MTSIRNTITKNTASEELELFSLAVPRLRNKPLFSRRSPSFVRMVFIGFIIVLIDGWGLTMSSSYFFKIPFCSHASVDLEYNCKSKIFAGEKAILSCMYRVPCVHLAHVTGGAVAQSPLDRLKMLLH